MTYADLAIICTALKRPGYFRQTLDSWHAARHLGEVHSFTVALGYDDEKFVPMLNVITGFRDGTGLGARARVKVDSSAAQRSRGMGRAIGEAANHVLSDPAVQFAVFGEEDVVVSSDVLEYMAWARETFADDERVLAVCAHSAGGQGWDAPGIGATTADADQEVVRLLPYFNPWVWGTWRDRWERVIEPGWDWDCTKGPLPHQLGYDWELLRISQRGYVNVVPDASRSQNIGKDGGWAASPDAFESTQAASFRADRPGPVAYRIEETREQAA